MALGDLDDVSGDGIMADPAHVSVVTPLRATYWLDRMQMRRGFRSVVVVAGVRTFSTVAADVVAARVNGLVRGV